jgi:hypothetical protein
MRQFAPNQDDSALVATCIFRHAFLHALQLFGGSLALVFRLPFAGGHSVDEFARFVFGEAAIRLHHPVGEAIATETGEAHKVDIFGVMAVLEMRDEAAKGGRCGCVADFFALLHSYAPFP